MRLLTAEDNQEGYNNTDITRRVEALRNKSFFLIHGNADDNVHYQQSMLLAKALEHADIMFYQMVSGDLINYIIDYIEGDLNSKPLAICNSFSFVRLFSELSRRKSFFIQRLSTFISQYRSIVSE